jgi:SAM-dependent methyltransferase
VDSWWLDELALAGPEHLDPVRVAQYDRKAAFDPSADVALLCELGLGTESTLVDLGAGTGAFSLAAARACGRVVAIDVSSAMVATIEAKVARASLANVEVINAGFLGYRHAGAPADFVYSRNALHHLPDFWKAIALRNVAAMLRPGGVLRLRDLVFSFEPREADLYLEAWIATGAASSSDGWTPGELEAHIRNEHSTFGWVLERLLEDAGFEVRRIEYDALKVFANYVAVKRPVASS